MEAAPIAETVEVNNVEASFCDLQSKELNHGGVTESNNASEVTQPANDDKELTWEKIAAEISEENLDGIQEEVKDEFVTSVETSTHEPVTAEIETVIDTVTQAENVVENAEQAVEDNTEKNDTIESAPASSTDESLPESTEAVAGSESKDEVEVPEVTPTVEEPVEQASPLPSSDKDNIDTIIEISELKPDEPAEISDVIEEFEYTVVESEEVETNEIIEEHLAQGDGETETIVVINSDQTQTEIRIEQVEDDDKVDEDGNQYTEEIYLVSKENEEVVDDPGPPPRATAEKPKKQRGRKPITDIPLHVLGRDISKPSEGVSNGGRIMPKPRLGVKVPYRNLTSQIVSKEDIEKEIMERYKQKQEQNTQTSADILFARKLTQRLAKKLTPSDKDKTAKPAHEARTENKSPEAEAEIKNNSDLIAILEGDDEDVVLKSAAEEKQAKQGGAKSTEKEIALQQLKELPGKNRIFKSRGQNDEEKKNQKEAATAAVVSSFKPNVEKEKKSQIEVEPRVRSETVVKTYTRKRKSTDIESVLPLKKSLVVASVKSEEHTPSNVYITKSSRIIKRKVIWDPDEVPAKSPIKSPKPEASSKPAPAKNVEKKEQPEKRSTPQVKKSISKSPPLKKLKRLTEVDKLLMDEGAIKMLYDVKTNEESPSDKQKKKTNKSVISLDRAHKELMSKTSVIKNDLQQNTSKDVQKSLRKKEIVAPSPVSRKKSKDSVRSSVHSPPASPPYVAAEASRIIRRHSSSSFSSDDDSEEDAADEEKIRKKSASGESSRKKAKKSVDVKSSKDAKNNNTVSESSKSSNVDKALDEYKSFTATKKGHLFSIKLTSAEGKCYLSDQVLEELVACLKNFGEDEECHVLALTSANKESFCDGLDYSLLVVDDDSARQKKASELASLVKEFLRCLLNFPKVLVAGIQGDCVGLGVTMLPLFDMVVVSDSATFSAPYARLGSVPEAGFLLTVPYLSSNGLASELLYASQVVKADDAFRRGLVTRLCWPEKYQQELKTILAQVASQSLQSIVATKQQLRRHLIKQADDALSSIDATLVAHWTSEECQTSFSN